MNSSMVLPVPIMFTPSTGLMCSAYALHIFWSGSGNDFGRQKCFWLQHVNLRRQRTSAETQSVVRGGGTSRHIVLKHVVRRLYRQLAPPLYGAG